MPEWRTDETKREPGRRKIQWCLVFIVMAWYLGALVKVHIYPDRRAAEQLAKQYQQSERKAMDRGSIYDGRGEPLALSITTYSENG